MITEDERNKIRGSGNYRAAIWLTRLSAIAVVLALCSLYASKTQHESWLFPFFSFDLLLMLSIATALLLLHRSGRPFDRRGLVWMLRDRQMTSSIHRDVFWFRRR